MTNLLSKNWLTAKELAALKLTGMPATWQGINAHIRQENWRDHSSLARKRAGRGGGWEYHIDLLPEAARTDLEARRAEVATREARELDLKRISQEGVADLTARQRMVMEARAALLTEAEARRMRHGWRERRALLSIIEDHEAGRLDDDLRRAAERACERKRLSLRTLQLWARQLRDGGLVALAPRPKKRARALEEIDWLPDFLRYYQRPQKPSIPHALEMMVRDGLTPPSYDQVRRVLKRLSIPAREQGRDGRLAIRKYLPYVARDTSALQPTTIYSADGTTFDAEVEHPVSRKPFKPEVTTIIDVATRKIVGVSFGISENRYEVADALRRACTDHGIPAIFYVDRGPGYRNQLLDDDVTGLCARLGITKAHSLPRNAQARGIVEAVQKHWNRFARELPTYMGAGMDGEAARRVHLATRADIRKLGRSRRLPAWEEFMRAALDYVSRYNDRPHSALPRIRDEETGRIRHMSPNEAWAQAEREGFEPLLVSAVEADDLFRPMVLRQVRRVLVSFASQDYFAPELEELHGRKVFVGYDLQDASRVWVREAARVDGELAPGGLICVARWDGHKRAYFPESVIEQAEKRRVQAAIARKQRKIDALEEQLHPGLIDTTPEQPVNVVELRPEPIPVEQSGEEHATSENAQPLARADGRPVFATEAEHAAWLVAHPEQMTEQDRDAVIEYLNSPATLAWIESEGTGREDLLRLLGIKEPSEESVASKETATAAATAMTVR